MDRSRAQPLGQRTRSPVGGREDAASGRDPHGETHRSSTAGAPGALRVVVGTHAFDRPGGTETYVLTVARELHRLGHDPIIAAEEIGAMADFAERHGLAIARDELDLPPACDVVFAQDTIMGALLAERYPAARLVQFVHADSWDVQMPILAADAVDAVVVASDRIAERVHASSLDAPIVRLRQPIDTTRFADAGPLPKRPARALILSNYLQGERWRALVEAWEAAGVECIQLGVENAELDVVPAIGSADIVVGKARAVLEGMSCARAVYLYDQYGGDGWVTPARYPALEADAFAGLALDQTRVPAELAADLDHYDPDMGTANRELVRRHHGAHRHATALVDILRGPPPRRRRGRAPLSEVARLTRSAWYWEQRSHSAEAWVRNLQRDLRDAAAERSRRERELDHLHEQVRERVAQVERLRDRAARAEHEAGRLRNVLATRRVRMAFRLGGMLDRLRRRQ